MPEFTFHMRGNVRTPLELTVSSPDRQSAIENLPTYIWQAFDPDEVDLHSITVIEATQDGEEIEELQGKEPIKRTIWIVSSDWPDCGVDIDKFNTKQDADDWVMQALCREYQLELNDESRARYAEHGANDIAEKEARGLDTPHFQFEEFEV